MSVVLPLGALSLMACGVSVGFLKVTVGLTVLFVSFITALKVMKEGTLATSFCCACNVVEHIDRMNNGINFMANIGWIRLHDLYLGITLGRLQCHQFHTDLWFLPVIQNYRFDPR